MMNRRWMPATEMFFNLNNRLLACVLVLLGAERYYSIRATEILTESYGYLSSICTVISRCRLKDPRTLPLR
jgi:hypothetical protein